MEFWGWPLLLGIIQGACNVNLLCCCSLRFGVPASFGDLFSHGWKKGLFSFYLPLIFCFLSGATVIALRKWLVGK